MLGPNRKRREIILFILQIAARAKKRRTREEVGRGGAEIPTLWLRGIPWFEESNWQAQWAAIKPSHHASLGVRAMNHGTSSATPRWRRPGSSTLLGLNGATKPGTASASAQAGDNAILVDGKDSGSCATAGAARGEASTA